MNPWLLQAISDQRQQDIARRTDHQVRLSGDLPTRHERSWDTRLGWALIHVGLRLLGDDPRGVAVRVAGTPGC